ncbi:PREDICTED: mitochondrial dicarboxylate carrier [Vollenhovia emeryi]|uniref:mitochondrial dicarboxylate carrier n=1 Tax=Vollenhovia emeryi TaxID=411798 RepID=UPI0005F47D5E|nr:PREDICTED: mitochondrial dicarboxylate carrier [Vollenhovia emeryi]
MVARYEDFSYPRRKYLKSIPARDSRQSYSANDRVMAQVTTHPMDVLKIRMQVSHDTLCNAALRTFRTSGICGFYTGLSAALLRQLTYTASRLGLYTTLLDIGEQHFGYLNYVTMISLGMVAGMMGSLIGTPTDLVLIRMVADLNLPPGNSYFLPPVSFQNDL